MFDHAIYSEALEILMNPLHNDLQKFCNIRMGPFHAIGAFLAVLGVRFGVGALRDLVIECGLLREGSLNAALTGKHYNSALLLHKCIYEATMHRKFDALEEWSEAQGKT